jgi:lipopolysaccharide/colanic/teichoic acid biosynthesis glycosyltransferase
MHAAETVLDFDAEAILVAGAEVAQNGRASRHDTSRGAAWNRAARPLVSVTLALGDAASYLVAGFGLHLLGWPSASAAAVLAGPVIATVALHGMAGLYPGYETDPSERLRRRALAALKVLAIGCLLAALVTHEAAPVLWVAVAVVVATCLQSGLHRALRQALHGIGLWGERALLLASPELSTALQIYFSEHWQIGILPVLPSFDAAPGACEDTRLALLTEWPESAEQLTRLCETHERVLLLGDTPFHRVSGVSPRSTGGRIGVCLGSRRNAPLHDSVSRVIDVAVAVPLLLASLPALAFSALLIRIVDPGPAIYTQIREGLNGRKIRIYKLRTMFLDAEARLDTLLATDPSAAREWESTYKLKDDPRILPLVGRPLRAFSLDELPQLVNVIRGDMRLVGPRPFPEYHLAAMGAEFRDRRRRLVPGLTGLWQVSARSNADVGLQRQLDDFYIENRSFWLDLHILRSTLSAVFGRRGAY